jgi:hypothetical protein
VLKVNVYERMQFANTQLMPLFPYYGAGAIVPCGAILRGGAEKEFGHFFHWNTADELVIVFGAEGAMLATGQVYVTQPLHGVNSFLKNPRDPNSFIVLTVTQRQSVGQFQAEAVIFRCGKCHEQLLRHEYDASPPEPPGDGPDDTVYQEFVTLRGSSDAAQQLNSDEAMRTCPKCGYVNPPFPLDTWGWVDAMSQNQTVNGARRALLRTAQTQLTPA